MLELNPGLVDQDRIRKNKRKHLMKVVFLPVFILILISVFFFRTTFFNIVYGLSYDNQNYNTASFLTDEQKIGNIISPYVAYFDTGTINLKRGQYEDAEQSFRDALKENPPRNILCQVYVNLSLSVELQAQELYDKGKYEDALVKYNAAQAILYENNCANKDNPGESADKKAGIADKRLTDKRALTVARMNLIEQNASEGGNTNYSPINSNDLDEIRSRQDTENAMDNIRNNVTGSPGNSCYPSSTKECW